MAETRESPLFNSLVLEKVAEAPVNKIDIYWGLFQTSEPSN